MPQLRLLALAAARLKAGQALLDLRVSVAAAAAGFGGAKKMVTDLQTDLKRQMDQK